MSSRLNVRTGELSGAIPLMFVPVTIISSIGMD